MERQRRWSSGSPAGGRFAAQDRPAAAFGLHWGEDDAYDAYVAAQLDAEYEQFADEQLGVTYEQYVNEQQAGAWAGRGQERRRR